MGFAINLIVFLLIIVGVLAFAMTDSGREKLTKLKELFKKFQSMFFSSGNSGSNKSLVSQLFYQYNHAKLEDWINWIAKQDEASREEALNMLIEHLEGKSKYWGNITEEVLTAIKEFKDMQIFSHMALFYQRLINCWPEYRVIPRLFQHTAKICYSIDSVASLELFENEFSGERINSPDFEEIAQVIIDTVVEASKPSIEFLVSVIDREIVPIETRRYALSKYKSLDSEAKVRFIEKVLDPYLKNQFKLEKKPKETDQSHEDKCDLFRSIIDIALNLLNDTKIFQTISQFCKFKKDINRITVQAILSDINNCDDLSPLKLFAYFQLPDSETLAFTRAIAKHQNIRDDIIRKLILKKRILDLNFETLVSRVSIFSELPISEPFEKSYKSFKTKLVNSQQDLFSSEQNGVLLMGRSIYEKVYFARALTLEHAEAHFSYYDISKIKDKQTIEKMKSALAGKAGWDMPLLLFLDSVEAFFENQTDLKEPLAELFEAYCKFAIKGDITIIGSTTYPKEHIDANKLLKDKFDYMTDRLFLRKWDIDFEAGFKDYLCDSYKALINGEDDDTPVEFFETLKGVGENMPVMEFCSFLEEELVLQLICFGKIKSISQVDEFKKQVL